MPTGNHHKSTPAQMGYRMPAEWEPHDATWVSWPHLEGTRLPEAHEGVMDVLAHLIDALADSEPVCINVLDADEENEARAFLLKKSVRTEHVRFFHIPTNEPWCRDHGPVFLVRDKAPQLAVVNWDYNGWGWKYPPFDLDEEVPTEIANHLGAHVFEPGMVLEGGSIEVNGKGTLITTRSCLLNPNRNPDLTKQEIEQKLSDYLGVTKILWLGDGIAGDEADGHVDDLTRFVDHRTVVTVIEENEEDPNYEPLQANLALLRAMTVEDGAPLDVHLLPMPRKIAHDDRRIPASYANFYIANKVVLLPTFGDPCDAWAISVLQAVFKDRKIVPIDCRQLTHGLGAFHCLTQQQPQVKH